MIYESPADICIREDESHTLTKYMKPYYLALDIDEGEAIPSCQSCA